MSSATLDLLYLALFVLFLYRAAAADPTDGFTSLPLDESNFEIQRPYDVPVSQRYSYDNGVHKMWVYSTDKPHFRDSATRPRTEVRIQGYDYSFGVWQFEGYAYVPVGTSEGVCVMQVFGASSHATTLMLRVYSPSLMYYRDAVIVPNIYNRWFRVNVIHDVDANKVQVYIDGGSKVRSTWPWRKLPLLQGWCLRTG